MSRVNAHEFKPSALRNILTGTTNNAGSEFTLRSNKTATEYTFKLLRSAYRTLWFTHAFVEHNYLEFHYVGHYYRGTIWHKHKEVTTPAAVALAWFLRQVEKAAPLKDVTVYHFGKCVRCGRTLTDSTSIELGMGPTCRA